MPIYPRDYEALRNAKASKKCERCWVWDASIRKIDKELSTVEFICELCKDDDEKLKKLPVERKIK